MKKVLSFFLSLNIIMMCIPYSVFAVSLPEITSYGFMSVDGKVITTLGGETSVKAYVDIDNINHITSNNLGNLVATCTVDGILVSTTTLPITIDSHTYLKRMETNAINVPTDSANIVFKVFIMDTLQNIRPVVNMYRWGTNPNAVNDGTKYADAIKTVTGLGIMNGYEDGSFGAEGDVTRAEFAAVMIRLINREQFAQDAKSDRFFSDVSELHWASGYINLAARIFNMSGYEDGRFGPDNNMTLEIATKALVIALGYEPSVVEPGHPLAYLYKANELGITNDISLQGADMISRGALAKLVANSLDVPLLVQTGYGVNITYYVQDGFIGTERKTILSEYRNLIKLQVFVNEYAGFTSNSNNLKVTILNNYRTKYSSDFPVGTNYTLDAGTSNISELVGRKAIVYVAYDDSSSGTPVVVYAYKDTTKSNELTVLAENIESVYSSSSYNPYTTVEYWANETDGSTTIITFPASAKFYVNGALTAYPPNLMNVYGSISFAKNNASTVEDYDTVFITNYTNFVVDYINPITSRVYSKNAGTISFNPTDTTAKSTLYNTNGKQMNWADLKEWDVVSCRVVNGSRIVTVGQLVNNKITGKIVEISDIGTTYAKYVIDTKTYKTDPIMMGKLALADEGTFYLDILGKICWFKDGTVISTPTPVPATTPTPVPLTSGLVVISGTSSGTNTTGDLITKFKTFENGIDTTIDSSANYTSVTPTVGTTVIPVKNGSGEITSLTTVAVPNADNDTVNFTIPVVPNTNYIYGLVKERKSSTVSTTGGDFTVPSSANVYVYDERTSSSSNKVTFDYITIFDAQLTNNITTYDYGISKIYAIAREYDGKITDVVIYIFQ